VSTIPESTGIDASGEVESVPGEVSACVLSPCIELSPGGAWLSIVAASPQFGAQLSSWMLSRPAIAEQPARPRSDHTTAAVSETLPTGKQYREFSAAKGSPSRPPAGRRKRRPQPRLDCSRARNVGPSFDDSRLPEDQPRAVHPGVQKCPRTLSGHRPDSRKVSASGSGSRQIAGLRGVRLLAPALL